MGIYGATCQVIGVENGGLARRDRQEYHLDQKETGHY